MPQAPDTRARSKVPRFVILGLIGTAVLVGAFVVRDSLRDAASDRDDGYSRARLTTPPSAEPAAAPTAAFPPPPPPLPDWIEVRVSRVELAGTQQWDGTTPEPALQQLCGLVDPAIAVGAGIPGIAALFACHLTASGQQQTDPRDPDLRVLLEAPRIRYGSYAAMDSRAVNFDYAFAMPGSSVTGDGVLISVVDADSGEPSDRGQEIGSTRLTEQDIRDALASGRIVTRQTPNLATLEFSITAHDGNLRSVARELDTSEGGMTVYAFPVYAGDIVRIEADGEWQIGTVHDKLLGPAGYEAGILQDSNLEHFHKAGHGSAVALVGQHGWANTVEPQPCVRFVSEYSGVVWVGVNDQKPGDNRGIARFKVQTRGAQAGEWAQPGGMFRCK